MPIANLKQTPIENIAFEFLQANTIYPANDPIWEKIKQILFNSAKEEIEKSKECLSL